MRILVKTSCLSITLMALAPTITYADKLTSTLNQTTAQTSAAAAYKRCTNDALYGKKDGECVGAGESNGCVGATRAFKNSKKKTKCFIPIKFFCALWGHKQNSKTTWISVGGKHLANAAQCVTLAGIAVDFAKDMETGTDYLGKSRGASFLEGLDDGSSSFGLDDGSLLKGLLEGKDLASMLENSPYYKGLNADEQAAVLEAANKQTLEADDPDFDLTGSTNPAQEGYGDGGGSALAGGQGSENSLDSLLVDANGNPLGREGNDPFADALNKLEDADAKSRGLSSADAELARKYKSMLDRTIFEMVRSQYQKNMPDLVGMDQFLKRQQKQRPKDIKSVVGAGNSSARL